MVGSLEAPKLWVLGSSSAQEDQSYCNYFVQLLNATATEKVVQKVLYLLLFLDMP